jgi:hypothetical protein
VVGTYWISPAATAKFSEPARAPTMGDQAPIVTAIMMTITRLAAVRQGARHWSLDPSAGSSYQRESETSRP